MCVTVADQEEFQTKRLGSSLQGKCNAIMQDEKHKYHCIQAWVTQTLFLLDSMLP